MSDIAPRFVIEEPALPEIKSNLNIIRFCVEKKIAKYEKAVYTDEQMKIAKADRADLRHLKDEIEARRKQVKAAWNAPYLNFENEIKKITALIDAPVALIDGQVKNWEERRRAERVENLRAVFEHNNTLGDLLKFEKVADAEMLKLSTSDTKANNLLRAKLEKIAADLATVESVLAPDFRAACLSVFFDTLDIAAAVAKQTQLRAEKEKQDAILGAAEPEQIRATNAQNSAAVDDVATALNNRADDLKRAEIRIFAITGNPVQVDAVRKYANSIGVKMREIF